MVASGGGGITRLGPQDEKLKAPRQRTKKQKVECRCNDLAFRLVMVAAAIAVDEQRNPRSPTIREIRVKWTLESHYL